MRRRGGDVLAELGDVPAWLRVFDAAAWVDERDAPPDWWAFGAPMWRFLGAREQWRQAGLSWLDDRGRRADWFALTRSPVVSR